MTGGRFIEKSFAALSTEVLESSPLLGYDLISRAQAGDGEAFDEICRIHGDRLLRQAIGLCRDAALAEDLVQETLIAAWRGLPGYNRQCQFFTWLCSILIRRHQNSIRRTWPQLLSTIFRNEPDRADEAVTNMKDRGNSPDDAAEKSERAVRVLRSLDCLPDRQRQVVYLRYYADASLEEIAAALDCSIGTVKSRLFHGLDRLRRMKSLSTGVEL